MEEKEKTKSKIIKSALLYLGFPFDDADSKEAAEIKAASSLFDTALNSILKDNDFTFNVDKVYPKLTDRAKYMGKYEYIKPPHYICSITAGVEERGGKLYTVKNNFALTYKKKMDVKDIPEEYYKYLALTLAEEIAPTVGKAKALQRIAALRQQEKEELMYLSSYDITMEDLS